MTNDGASSVRTPLEGTVDAVVWGLFLIWIGLAVIGDFGWAAGLLGVAALIFGGQAVLHLAGRQTDAFMLTCGVSLLVAATWEIFAFAWSLVAVLLIITGIAIVMTSLIRRRNGPRRPAEEPLLPL